MRVLLFDDDPTARALSEALRAHGVDVRGAPASSRDPGALVAVEHPDVIVLGPAARAELARLMAAVSAQAPAPPVVVVGEQDRAEAALEALRTGAIDYLAFGAPEIAARVAAAGSPPAPARARTGDEPLAGLVGASLAMERIRALVRTAARTEAPVLIEGETGTGKEVVARAIHGLGPRRAGPFVPLNCAAIPETLAESEFFGHARGAFTGALESRPGALRLADGGTLFLDEIEDLPLALQAKLLRVVQDGEVRPLGGSTPRRVNVRLVAASNRELSRMVEAGTFRRDLYYRLRVLTIHLPPLRERGADLPLLVAHFVARLQPAPRHALRRAGAGAAASPSGPSLARQRARAREHPRVAAHPRHRRGRRPRLRCCGAHPCSTEGSGPTSAPASCACSTTIAGTASAPPPRSASRASPCGGAWSGTAFAIRSRPAAV